MGLTLFLGNWQLQRLEWKENLIKEFNNLLEQKPLSLSMGKMKYRNMDEFTKIITKGTVDRSKKIFFPAKTHNGKNGFFIASLLTDNHNNQYLIDEGWFEYNKFEYFKSNNQIISSEIIGYLRYPTEKKMFTPKNSPETNEWYYYDLEEIQKYFQTEINQNFFIKSMSSHGEEFLFPSTAKHNFTNNHLQYAITWFLMSFSILAIFIIYLIRNYR
ncbi:SURF1 family protein [Pelagibacteraceae bacterium]|nr:SURF1 family protein [Pelagibacteraceae bacterium]